MTNPYKYILTPPVLCSQQLSVLHSMSNLLISKTYFTEFYNVFAVYVKQAKHAKQLPTLTQTKIRLESVSYYEN